MGRPNRPRLAVVGGGVTGLAAAYELRRRLPEASIALYEAADRLGGKVRTLRRDGYVIETGPDSIVAEREAGMDLIRELGLESQVIPVLPQSSGILLYDRGRLLPLPEGMLLLVPPKVMPFLRSPLFSWRAKLEMALERFRPPVDGGDESIAAFVRRRFGEEAVRKLGQPLLAGIHSGDAERLSIRATFPQLKAMEGQHGSLTRAFQRRPRAGTRGPSPFVSLRRGMEQLVDHLAGSLDGVELRLETPLEALPEADGVILAVPACQAAGLVPDPRLADHLRKQPYSTGATVSLGYARGRVGHPLDTTGFLTVPGCSLRLKGATFSSSKFQGRAPEGKVLLRAFYTEDLPEAELIDLARRELGEVLGISGDPDLAVAFRYPSGNPQYEVGHQAWVEELERLLQAHPRLKLAGASYRGVGIPECIRQGREAAAVLLS